MYVNFSMIRFFQKVRVMMHAAANAREHALMKLFPIPEDIECFDVFRFELQVADHQMHHRKVEPNGLSRPRQN